MQRNQTGNNELMYQHLMCGGRQPAARSPALGGGHVPPPESCGDAKSFKAIVKASSVWGFERGAPGKSAATCRFNAFSPPSERLGQAVPPRALEGDVHPWCLAAPRSCEAPAGRCQHGGSSRCETLAVAGAGDALTRQPSRGVCRRWERSASSPTYGCVIPGTAV